MMMMMMLMRGTTTAASSLAALSVMPSAGLARSAGQRRTTCDGDRAWGEGLTEGGGRGAGGEAGGGLRIRALPPQSPDASGLLIRSTPTAAVLSPRLFNPHRRATLLLLLRACTLPPQPG